MVHLNNNHIIATYQVSHFDCTVDDNKNARYQELFAPLMMKLYGHYMIIS